jgi:hypothetical protein
VISEKDVPTRAITPTPDAATSRTLVTSTATWKLMSVWLMVVIVLTVDNFLYVPILLCACFAQFEQGSSGFTLCMVTLHLFFALNTLGEH